MDRRRALMAASEKKAASPYAFYFNIVTTEGRYEANAEDLAILNKGLSIIIELAGEDFFDYFTIDKDTAPQEFDLRINGVRDFSLTFMASDDTIDCYLGFNDGVTLYYGHTMIQTSNPIFESFKLYKAQ